MTFVDHLNSCARQCIAISEVLGSAFSCDMPVQLDHLIAGSLLADVGKPLEFDKDVSGNLQNTLAANVHLASLRFCDQ